MTLSLDELQTRRARLLDRLTSLTSRVASGDRSVQYDLSQAESALKVLDGEIAAARAAAAPAAPVRAIRITTRSGY